jgi:2Fe-2S ferredoxin
MGSITFIEHDGTEHVADIEEGKSLMQAAMDNGVPGIDADCGGSCACGTCHVIVDTQWFDKTGSADETEQQMLDLTPEKAETSRLSCQVELSEDMDGMVVRLPEFQM